MHSGALKKKDSVYTAGKCLDEISKDFIIKIYPEPPCKRQ